MPSVATAEASQYLIKRAVCLCQMIGITQLLLAAQCVCQRICQCLSVTKLDARSKISAHWIQSCLSTCMRRSAPLKLPCAESNKFTALLLKSQMYGHCDQLA